MDEDPDLAELYDRLKHTIDLVRESANSRAESGVRNAELKLSPDRREKLLAHFKTVTPKEFATKPRSSINRRLIIEWSAVAAVALLIGAIAVPNFVKTRETSAKNTVINNLRLVDGAKQTWALEANASASAIPQAAEIAPYLGRGGNVDTNLSSITFAGETYVMGKVTEVPAIEMPVGKARRLFGRDVVARGEQHDGLVRLSMDDFSDQPHAVAQAKLSGAYQFGAAQAGTDVPRTPGASAETHPTQNRESKIVGQDATVWMDALSQGTVAANNTQNQPQPGAQVAFDPTTGQPITPPAPPSRTQIVLPSSNQDGNQQLAMNSTPVTVPTTAWTVDTHNKAGNITSADGSVQQASIDSLRNQFASTTDNWNFPTNSFADVGVLGRTTRQTPWQTTTIQTGSAATASSQLSASVQAFSNGIMAEPDSHNLIINADSHTTQQLLDLVTLNRPNTSEQTPQSTLAANEILGQSATLSGVTNYQLADSYNSQTAYRSLSQLGDSANHGNIVLPPSANNQLAWNSSPTARGFYDDSDKKNGVTTGSTRDDISGLRYLTETNAVAASGTSGFALSGSNTSADNFTFNGGLLTANENISRRAPAVQTENANPQQVQHIFLGPVSKDSFASTEPGQNTTSPLIAREQENAIIPETPPSSGGGGGGAGFGGGGGGGVSANNQSFVDRVGALEQRGGKLVEMAPAAKPQPAFPRTPPTEMPNGTSATVHEMYSTTAGAFGGTGVYSVTPGASAGQRAKSPSRTGGKQVEMAAAAKQRESNGEASGPPVYTENIVGYVNVTNAGSLALTPLDQPPVQLALQDQSQKTDLTSAKQKLDSEKEWLDALKRKAGEESADKQLPATQMVTVIDSATAATTAKPTLGEKLRQTLSGKVERTARIAVEQEHPDIASMEGAPPSQGYDSDFLQTEFAVIQSENVLKKAAEKLNADKNGNAPDVTVAQLKKALDLHAEKNSKVVDIEAKSVTGNDAARIANAVANAYGEYRLEQYKEIKKRGLESLQEQVNEQQKKVELAQANVDELRKKSNVSNEQQADAALPKPAVPPPTPQPEILTTQNAFSTFSMNVADVSFKLAAAALEKGQMPEPASIRSEEFINAFDYRDPEAAPGTPVAFNYDRALYPFAHNRELLRFSLKTAAAGRQAGRPLNIVLLLDNSGSMERADRVNIIREALRVLAAQLQPQDTFSIVTFARTARLRVDGIPGNQAAAAADEIAKLTPEGGTNLGEALDTAYQTALHHYLANGDNRVILLTDGAANLGDVDPDSLKHKVVAQRQQGISLDCFGIGWEGYNDDLLEVLTRDGDGRYGFVNTPEEAGTEFVTQIAGALHVAAQDVKVQVEFNPNRVTSYRQIGYAKHQLTKEQFRDNTVAAAQIAAQEAGNALYTIEINPQGEGSIGTVRIRYKVPATGEIREQAWDVPYTGTATPLEQSSTAMRLAATASAFSEWLAASPFADQVTTDQLLNYLNGIPQIYGADTRPQKLEWMIRQAKSISGK
jgi:Mg-chelatase subunit ChlD